MQVHAHPAPSTALVSTVEQIRRTRAAPPPATNPFEFVMSDNSVDRYGDIIEPTGWDLDAFHSNPIALFGHSTRDPIGTWKNVRVVGNQLIGELVLAAKGTSVFIDTLRKLIEQRIMRAVSVGFVPIKAVPIDPEEPWDGMHFLEQELVECSLVAVPANANALNTVKALNLPRELMAGLFCKSASEDPALTRAPPASKPAKPLVPKGAKMNTRAERIQSAQESLNTMRDQLETLDQMVERSDGDEAEYLELPGRIEATTKSLAAMEAAEKALTGKTGKSPTTAGGSRPIIVGRGPVLEHRREYLYKAATALFLAKMQSRSLEDVLRDRYPGDENLGMVVKTAIAPANTTVAGWAAELVGTAIADFLNAMPRSAIYPRISTIGTRFTFGANGIIKVPARSATPKVNGSFVGEGQPIPVRKLGLVAITMTPKKMAVISEFTREMAAHSTPSIESVIRQAMNEDTAEAIDTALIDAVAADTIRPAGLLNGLVAIGAAATGTQFEKMVADINALMAPIAASRGGQDLVLIMNVAQALKMAWAVAPNGTFVFQSVENGVVRNLTVIASTTVPAGQLIMLDASQFASATGDTPEFDVSDVATIHEEDTAPLPIVGGTVQPPILASVAAPVRSLWQTASVGIRMLLPMNWAMRRTGMVTFMNGVTW